MRPHDETPYTPGKTLRETITPLLDELGYGWDDVSGMALAVEGNGLGDVRLGDWLEGTSLLRTVPQESIPDVLDAEGDWSWGAAPEGMGAIHHSFDATLWLPGHVIRFAPRYRTGDYVGCDVTPTAAPEAYGIDLTAAPSPRR